MPPGEPASGRDGDDHDHDGPAAGRDGDDHDHDGPAAERDGDDHDGSAAERDDATAAFLAGGPDGLRAAYEAHGRLVLTFCRRALGPDRAADVTQEVFIELWRSRDRFDASHGTLRGWIMGIARFKVLGALRHDGARPAVPVDLREGDGPTAAAEQRDIEVLADRLTLAQALATLPDRTRKAIQLSFVDGLSHREIADRMGLPLGSVKSDIRRGIQRLRLDLDGAS